MSSNRRAAEDLVLGDISGEAGGVWSPKPGEPGPSPAAGSGGLGRAAI